MNRSESQHNETGAALPLPVLMADGQTPLAWAKANQEAVNEVLEHQGAVLVRGLNFVGNRLFSGFLSTLFAGDLGEYVYRSTPRLKLKGNVYTASEYPADQSIPLHNENAYANRWPARIGFLCMVAATHGGQTPICDSRKVYRDIDPAVREEFERKQVMYVRNYGELDLPWQEVFQTDDRHQVEAYCRENQLNIRWVGANGCRTEQINPAVQRHGASGEMVWFNQAHLFHVSSLPTDVKEQLVSTLGEQNLPRHALFGDGSAIDSRYLEHIREVYRRHEIAFDWRPHDVMLLDNLLFAHGRRPFEGERQVLVGMA